jgi:L-asparaginase
MINRRRVDVLALGGTIAMAPSADAAGVTPQLTAEALVGAVPALAELADIRAQTLRTIPGASLEFSDVLATARAACACVDAGASGVVITQGTDSLEETAFAFDLLWDRPEPLVVTGAMRPASAAGADGPGNVFSAVAVARAAQARDRGCLVVFADEVHAARAVAKTHTTRTGAFASPGAGPVGWVSEGTPGFSAAPSPRSAALTPGGGDAPDVALVTAVLGDGGAQLRAIGHPFTGLVLAAMGAGHIPQRLLPDLERLAERMPVAAASRTGAGPLLRSTYGFSGSERDLIRLGLLDSCGLGPLKARVLLTLALWSTEDRGTAEELFRVHAARTYQGGRELGRGSRAGG